MYNKLVILTLTDEVMFLKLCFSVLAISRRPQHRAGRLLSLLGRIWVSPKPITFGVLLVMYYTQFLLSLTGTGESKLAYSRQENRHPMCSGTWGGKKNFRGTILKN